MRQIVCLALPMATLIGPSIPALLAGNLICEYVFNYQGLGLLFYSLGRRAPAAPAGARQSCASSGRS
jgi:hypothetical protein